MSKRNKRSKEKYAYIEVPLSPAEYAILKSQAQDFGMDINEFLSCKIQLETNLDTLKEEMPIIKELTNNFQTVPDEEKMEEFEERFEHMLEAITRGQRYFNRLANGFITKYK